MPETTSILSTIDHAVLAPNATHDDVVRGCELAARLGVASICVQPIWVPAAVAALADSSVAVGTVAGFPLGATTTEAKTLETMQAFESGATEVDMVMSVTALKSRDYERTLVDMAMVVEVARESEVPGAMVKAILEMCYLTEEEKRLAVGLALRAGVDFVKTSTGTGPGGATVEDVALLRELAPEDVGVKAAGGIRDLETMREMLNAGASRIGTSSTEAIAAELGVGN